MKIIGIVCLGLIAAGCCGPTVYDACSADVQITDANGQPIDALLVLRNRTTREEFSRLSCPGSCILEVEDLFTNGEWVTAEGLLLQTESTGKQSVEHRVDCGFDGMIFDDIPVEGVVIIQMIDDE